MSKEFKPFIPAESTEAEMTLKALAAGVLMSALFGAANAYLAMKAGQTIAATIPAAVIAIALFRLPPYSPELNPIEPVWKTTRKLTMHNRFYRTTGERDAALRKTFGKFRRQPSLIASHVARYR